MTNEDNVDFNNSSKCWIWVNDDIDNVGKVKDHCHITGKHRGAAHRVCNINLELNNKIPVVFYNLKKSHLILQELGKSNLEINFVLNGLEKYMSFIINNKLSLKDSFQIFKESSSLDSLVKNLSKDDFKYLSQEFDNNVLDLVQQKGFYPYEYVSKEELLSIEKFYSFIVPWLAEKLLTRNINMFLLFGINLKWKRWKIVTTFI